MSDQDGQRQITADEILHALREVEDPDLHRDIVAGLRAGSEIDGDAVRCASC